MADPSLAATLSADSLAQTISDASLAETHAADASLTLLRGDTLAGPVPGRGNTTVLPRIDVDANARPVVVANTQDRYREVKSLGEGGMGEVALVRDEDIGRDVAVKRMLPAAVRPTTLARFVEEVRTIGALEHPGIVPIHDVGLDAQGRYFFVMKYVDGHTLEHIIEKLRAGDAEFEARYPIEERMRIAIQLLQSLSYAHARGVVHRDLKPANVMVGRFGEVVLMDWGIAKRVGGQDFADSETGAPVTNVSDATPKEAGRTRRALQTQAGQLLGTPAYMSPEQARGANAELDARSDLYSATVLLHELFALRHYLEHKTTLLGLLHGVAHDEFTFNDLIVSSSESYPAALAHFAAKGLLKDPAKRYQSADEMIEVIHLVQSGQNLVQCPITATRRVFGEAGRFVDRYPRLATTAFMVSAVALLAGAGYIVSTFV
jgi:serine/threonine protein kinase